MRVGVGEVDITPQVGISMAGLPNYRESEGVHDKIYTWAMVFDDGFTQVALVTCGLLALKRQTVIGAREIIEKKFGIPGRNVMISATHSHSGPQTTDIFSIKADEDYVKTLPDKIAGALGRAVENATEARIGIGSVNEYRLSYNRRFIMRDVTSECQPEKDSDEVLWNEGPIDPQVGVLFAEDMGGKVIGVLVNFACHPTCTCTATKNLISADYPGYIDPVIRKIKGDGVVVLFANGALGNINHVDYSNPNTNEFGYEWARWMGSELARDALRVMEATNTSTECSLGVRSEVIKIPIREIPDEDLKRAKEASEGAKLPITSPQEWRGGGLTANFLEHPFWRGMWAREIVLLAEEKEKNPNVDVEVQAISVGNSAFVGVPVEYFAEFGLEMKEKSKIKPAFVVGLANGCAGYVPTLRAFKGGGYETKTACSSKLVPEAGRMILDTAMRLLRKP